jgi:hypothetical protein
VGGGGRAPEIQPVRLRITVLHPQKDLVTNTTDGKASDVSSKEIRHTALGGDAVL